jgi:hypothetical protein
VEALAAAEFGVMPSEIMSRFLIILVTSAFLYIPICSASEVSHPPTFQQMKDASNPESRGGSAIYEALKYNANDVKLLISRRNPDYIIGAAYQYDKHKIISFLKDYFPLLSGNMA